MELSFLPPVHAAEILATRSLRGPGRFVFRLPDGSDSGSSICANMCRCSINACISSRDRGSALLAICGAGPKEARFNATITTHAHAKPAQIRRLGQINSRHSVQPTAKNTFLRAGVPSDRSSGERLLVHIRSSFGSTDRCCFKRTSRGVFIMVASPTVSSTPAWRNAGGTSRCPLVCR